RGGSPIPGLQVLRGGRRAGEEQRGRRGQGSEGKRRAESHGGLLPAPPAVAEGPAAAGLPEAMRGCRRGQARGARASSRPSAAAPAAGGALREGAAGRLRRVRASV